MKDGADPLMIIWPNGAVVCHGDDLDAERQSWRPILKLIIRERVRQLVEFQVV